MPALPDTGRRYLDQTRRARLASPGLERFVREKSHGPRILLLAALLAAALIAAMLWLSQNG